MIYDGTTVKAWAGDSQWRALRADYARFRDQGFSAWKSEGFWALLFHRGIRIIGSARPRWLLAPVVRGLRMMRRFFTIVSHIDIDPDAEIGPGMFIPHVGNIRVFGRTRIGAGCSLFQGCTIGVGPQPGAGGAIIGDHVFMGCNSSIIGEVTIGDGATIAANSLVIANVPAGMTAIGVPARMLPKSNHRADPAASQSVVELSSSNRRSIG